MVFCMPALVTDRMGLISLVRAVILRYLGEGQESSMQVQYADISQSLNESLESPEFDTGRSYWMSNGRRKHGRRRSRKASVFMMVDLFRRPAWGEGHYRAISGNPQEVLRMELHAAGLSVGMLADLGATP